MTAAAFDAVLAGHAGHLVRDDGVVVSVDASRWRSPADLGDAWLLDRCTGPTLDLGCGPGRLVAALIARGVPALGIDSSRIARTLCARRSAPMIRRDVFAQLPSEGSWAHVLLADGNIGIGGDPARLLTRAATLLAPGGTVLVETGPQEGEWWRGTVRAGAGPAVPWACVGAATLSTIAASVRLTVSARSGTGPRSFVELVHHMPD